MPVYNAGDFLHEAIDSILTQKCRNWELICVDDRSQDRSFEILKSYARQNKQIRIYRNKGHQGVATTANFAISRARGRFIARMDADDVMLPRRIEKQLAFLTKRPNIVAVGGQCALINSEGGRIGEKHFPTSHARIYATAFQMVPMQQPTLMVNTSLLPIDFRWYEDGQDTAEEVLLLFRLFKHGLCANLKDYVLKYRIHQNNTSLAHPKKTFLLTYKARQVAIKQFGYQPTLGGSLVSNLQWFLVNILPEKAICPAFNLWRRHVLMQGKRVRPKSATIPQSYTFKLSRAENFRQ